jgi:hypothetical protein
MILISAKTGLFCRLAAYPGPRLGAAQPTTRGLKQTTTAPNIFGMLGDQPTAATATKFVYSRLGLLYNRQPMVAQAQFYPLLWSNTTVLNGSASIIFAALPTGAAPAPPGRKLCRTAQLSACQAVLCFMLWRPLP